MPAAGTRAHVVAEWRAMPHTARNPDFERLVTAILDSSCGYAAFSLMPPGAGVLSVEFKVNLMAPAQSGRRHHADRWP